VNAASSDILTGEPITIGKSAALTEVKKAEKAMVIRKEETSMIFSRFAFVETRKYLVSQTTMKIL